MKRAAARLASFVRRAFAPGLATINDYERQTASQFGEDGIIAEIFRRIGEQSRFFVEFGVEDGSQCNTAVLAARGWRGVMLEASEEKYARLADRYRSSTNVRVARRFVTAENIAPILRELDVPEIFDLLSIDIDGNDYWVWRALAGYRPRVVIIEYNAVFRPPQRWVMAYNPDHRWDGTTYYGAALESLAALGDSLGYALLGTTSEGVNAFFVRGDVLHDVGFPARHARDAYHPTNFIGCGGTLGHIPREGPGVEA